VRLYLANGYITGEINSPPRGGLGDREESCGPNGCLKAGGTPGAGFQFVLFYPTAFYSKKFGCVGKATNLRDRLAICGASNGGLLVSAVVTQRPELFRAVLCGVPLTDMIRFHKLGLANIWTEEYGSADDPKMFPHILAYSPYHNTKDEAFMAYHG